MASITVNRQTVVGDLRYASGTFDFDSAYPTGGEAFDIATLGFTSLDFIAFSNKSGVMFSFDYTASKVLAYFPTGGAGTPASALGTAAGTAASGASTASAVDATTPTVVLKPGVATQVPASQNLSTLTGVAWVAFGK